MMPWLLLVSALAAGAAESLTTRYAAFGELILTNLNSAPFPHPSRAQGHKYNDQFFSTAEHYSDNTVAVFIPKGFHEGARVDFVVHFHGWKNHVETVLGQYKLIEQFAASGRNAVLVVPQGPRDASDSGGGKLEDPGGFERFMNDVAAALRASSSLKPKDLVIGNIILSGHSGGYQVISSIVDHGGLGEHVAEVWLFDALYARTDQFLAWFDARQGRLIDLYTEHGGTKAETERLMARLKQRGTEFMAVNEPDLKPGDLKNHRLLFIFTGSEHNDVIDQHQEFRNFLSSSCLELHP